MDMPQRLIAQEPRICTYETYEDRPLLVNEVRVLTEYASVKMGVSFVQEGGHEA